MESQRKRTVSRRKCRVEQLEVRSLLSATALAAVTAQPLVEAFAANLATPAGLSPTQIRQAYGFNAISGNGAGQTIAIIDAYDDPNVAGDLHKFDTQFGLADPVFTKVNQTGGTSLPAASKDWAAEIALDVEWAHAVAPGANILLVEAKSSSMSDLLTAVNTARNYAGVSVVSMSWGGGESFSDTSYDSYFTTPSGHGNVTFVASSGDSGAGASYPASSPNVLAVGGTTLTLNSGAYSSETAWSGSGGGVSRYEAEPSWQKAVQSYGARSTPDVAYDANPNSGVSVYDSYGSGGWAVYGGTSIGAPQWAGLIAIVDQGRSASLKYASSDIYSIAKTSPADFHDITSGSNGYRATAGYDLVTGLGSPVANKLIADLISSTDAAPAASTSGTGSRFGGGFGGGGFGGGGFGGGGFGGGGWFGGWGRLAVAELPPAAIGLHVPSASDTTWPMATTDGANHGTAATSYLSAALAMDSDPLGMGSGFGSATSARFAATRFGHSDDLLAASDELGFALLDTPADRDGSAAIDVANLAGSTTVSWQSTALPAVAIQADPFASVAARDLLSAATVAVPDLRSAAVDSCFAEDSPVERVADSHARVDAVEMTSTSRAAALAVIPLIFSRFEPGDPAAAEWDLRRRRPRGAK